MKLSDKLEKEWRTAERTIRKEATSFLRRCCESGLCRPDSLEAVQNGRNVVEFTTRGKGLAFVYSRRKDLTDRDEKFIESLSLDSIIDLVEVAELFLENQKLSNL